jgi:hypothetical protein
MSNSVKVFSFSFYEAFFFTSSTGLFSKAFELSFLY